MRWPPPGRWHQGGRRGVRRRFQHRRDRADRRRPHLHRRAPTSASSASRPAGANPDDVIATMENCRRSSSPRCAARRSAAASRPRSAHTIRRVALPSTRVGLPEVHLGLLPGAGGTQRLPRLTGAKYALDAIISGRHIPAPEAKSKGIVVRWSRVARPAVGAVAHAQMLVAQNAPRRRVRDLTVTLESPDLFAETEKSIARRAHGKAPWNIIKCVQAAVELPFDEGMKRKTRAVRRAGDLVQIGRAALLLLRRARGGQGGSTCRPTRRQRPINDGRHHRRRHDGRRHRHELRQRRHRSRPGENRSRKRSAASASRPSAPTTTRTPLSAAA